MAQEIKVKCIKKTAENITTKAGKPLTIHKITGEDNTVYQTFSSTIASKINEGEERLIQYEVKTTGNFTNNNILNIADASGNFEEAEKKSFGGGGRSKVDTESIQRQVALKCAVELAVANKETDNAVIIATATELNGFLMEGGK